MSSSLIYDGMYSSKRGMYCDRVTWPYYDGICPGPLVYKEKKGIS